MHYAHISYSVLTLHLRLTDPKRERGAPAPSQNLNESLTTAAGKPARAEGALCFGESPAARGTPGTRLQLFGTRPNALAAQHETAPICKNLHLQNLLCSAASSTASLDSCIGTMPTEGSFGSCLHHMVCLDLMTLTQQTRRYTYISRVEVHSSSRFPNHPGKSMWNHHFIPATLQRKSLLPRLLARNSSAAASDQNKKESAELAG